MTADRSDDEPFKLAVRHDEPWQHNGEQVDMVDARSGMHPRHQHRWRGSTQFGVLHAVCVRCGRVTFNPWWPLWRLAKRNERDGVQP